MGTKNEPGQFDCYDAAAPDEPMFILLARDATAPFLVDLWASMREGDIYGAIQVFAELAQSVVSFDATGQRTEKTEEARRCAEAMRDWKSGRDT